MGSWGYLTTSDLAVGSHDNFVDICNGVTVVSCHFRPGQVPGCGIPWQLCGYLQWSHGGLLSFQTWASTWLWHPTTTLWISTMYWVWSEWARARGHPVTSPTSTGMPKARSSWSTLGPRSSSSLRHPEESGSRCALQKLRSLIGLPGPVCLAQRVRGCGRPKVTWRMSMLLRCHLTDVSWPLLTTLVLSSSSDTLPRLVVSMNLSAVTKPQLLCSCLFARYPAQVCCQRGSFCDDILHQEASAIVFVSHCKVSCPGRLSMWTFLRWHFAPGSLGLCVCVSLQGILPR